MYNSVDYIINGINDDSIYSLMEWQDYMMQDTINEINKLSDEEWQKLYDELPNKSMRWKMHFAECLTNFLDEHQLQAFIILLNEDNVELFDLMLGNMLHYNFNDIKSIIDKLDFADEFIKRVKDTKELVDDSLKRSYDIFIEKATEGNSLNK